MLTLTKKKRVSRVVKSLSVAVLLFAFIGTANAVEGQLPDDSKCLTCHRIKALKKTLESGEKLSLHVSRDDFAQSVHNVIGCAGCHGIIDLTEHKQKRPISSAHDYSVEQVQVCRNCHAGKFELYEGSVHASLVANGDVAAPVCTDCHGIHSIRPSTHIASIGSTPCKNCHEDVFDAYAQSVHGQALETASHLQVPICADCHQSHDIAAVATGDRLKETCISCHEQTEVAHDDWLPNAARHLDAVSCPACHAPLAERGIDLRLYDNEAQVSLSEIQGEPGLEQKIEEFDAAGDGLNSTELWSLVREANRTGQSTDISLRGRMEVRTGVDAHSLADKSLALRDCEGCHQGEAGPFDNVTISIVRPDGRRLRFDIDKDVLSGASSVDSISGFYAPVGTRIKLLDGLLLLSVFGGIAIPLTHMTAKRYLSKRRNKDN